MADRQIYAGIDAGVLHEEGVESYYVGIDAGVFTEDQAASGTPTGSGVLSAPLAVVTASATHTAPEFTAATVLAATLPVVTASATHTAPEFTAAVELTAGLGVLESAATHAAPEFTAAVVLQPPLSTIASSATFTSAGHEIPLDFLAVASSSSQIDLSWSHSGTDVVAFEIQRRLATV